MTYNPAIPQPTDIIAVSQDEILQNFDQLNSQFSVDHVAFNTGSGNGSGFHKQITFQNVAAPGAQIDPQSVMYTKANGSGNPVPYFRNSVSEYLLLGQAGIGPTNTPLQIRAGVFSFTPAVTSTAVSYSTAFPVATIAITFGGQGTQTIFESSAITSSGFTLSRPTGAGTAVAHWIAVGY